MLKHNTKSQSLKTMSLPSSPTQNSPTQSSFHLVKEQEEDDKVARILKPYCRFLVRFPYVVILGVMFIFIMSIILSVIPAIGAKDFPDFSNPTKGFEPRGTTISARRDSIFNLKKAYQNSQLTSNSTTPFSSAGNSMRRKRRTIAIDFNYKVTEWINGFFLVYEHVDSGTNLLHVDHMKSICKLHKEKILNFPDYNLFFYNTFSNHLPNYIAMIGGKDDCEDITTSDVITFANILKKCVTYYTTDVYKNCMNSINCLTNMTIDCESHTNVGKKDKKSFATLMYNTFQFFVDVDFINNQETLKLTGSVDFLFEWSTSQEFFLKPLYEKTLKNLDSVKEGSVKLAAFDFFDFRFFLFQSEIITQSLFIVTAIVLVILFIWFYSGSIFIGLMTFACILIALVISYFVYGRIFDLDFFPFLNMVTLIFIVGIGADDAFVYTGIWEEAKHIYVIQNNYEHEECMIKWTIHSLRHAVLAMLVTSLTTAAAFYANISSVVTSVKCFGLFAGTSIIVNYLLMITLFPAIVIMHEKYFARCMYACCPQVCKSRPILEIDTIDGGASNSFPNRVQNSLDRVSSQLFNKYLPNVLIRFRYVWIGIFLSIGIGGTVVTFGKPGLNPPSTGEFQMFTDNSPLEQFGLNYKKQFSFGVGSDGQKRSVQFVFGVKAQDNGNKFNPDDRGTVELHDGVLDLAGVQLWLRGFCRNLKKASFYQNQTGNKDFCDKLEDMFTMFTSTCIGAIPGCCNHTLPMDEAVFMKCFRKGLKLGGITDFGAPLFDRDGLLKTIIISGQSIYQYSDQFDFNKNAFETIDAWYENQIKNVTSTKFKGWWYLRMEFYDLQVSLFEGTKQSLGIAIAVAFVVILCTTFNVLLSLYSILTITFIISVTVGLLILSGWKLNIMESIVFSVAAGLSADFTLHYSVAYQTSLMKNNRVERMKSALTHIGPAILMGAFTTFLAGLVMVGAQVLVYFQMAQFLMLVMFVSWLYSTFFFLPLCATIGPVGNLGQLTCKKVNRVRRSVRNTQPQPVELTTTASTPPVAT